MDGPGGAEPLNAAPPVTPRRSMATRLICATPRQGKAIVNYSLGEKLGQGAHATVYRAIDVNSGATVAIKRIASSALQSLDVVVGEIELLADLEHPNIVQYLGFMRVDDDALYIVLEYCENGSLSALCHRFGVFPENLVAMYMGQVLEGLEYLHLQGAIHRDVKGANILTTKDGVAKLADFGVAVRIGVVQGDQGITGTPNWMAPEIIQMGESTAACDIWSLGCTVIELRTGTPPYGDLPDIAAMYAMVQNDMPPLPLDASSRMRDFLCLCFQKDFRLRSDATELKMHAWIRRHVAKQIPADPVQAVKDWNSPARRRLLQTPSKLNLREPKVLNEIANGTHERRNGLGDHDGSPMKGGGSPTKPGLLKFIEDDSFEAGFNDFNSNYERSQHSGAGPPVSEFSDKMQSIHTSKQPLLQSPYSQTPSLPAPQRPGPTPRLDATAPQIPIPGRLEPPARKWTDDDNLDDLADQLDIALSPKAQNSPRKKHAYKSDVFEGIGELLDDVPPERQAAAQEEAAALVSRLEEIQQASFMSENVADAQTIFMRLTELLVAEAAIKRPLADSHVLMLTLSLAKRNPALLAKPVIEFLLVLCEKNESFMDRFSLYDGLSVLLLLASQEPLRSVMFMREFVTYYKFGAHLLASRRDALQFLAEYVGATPPLPASLPTEQAPIVRHCSAQCMLAVFKDFHSCQRADVWRAFGAFTLWNNIMKALSQPDQSESQVYELYALVTYFARSPPDLVSETLTRHHLRQLMRCFRELEPESPYRQTIIRFLRDVSTIPEILTAMERGALGPHFVWILRECYAGRLPQQHAILVALLPLLHNFCRLSSSRQVILAKCGVLQLLHNTHIVEPALKEFSIPILLSMAHNPAVYEQLHAANGLESLVALLRHPGWDCPALAAITAWWTYEPEKVLPKFIELQGPHQLVYMAMSQQEGIATFILQFAALLETHSAELGKLVSSRPFLSALHRHLPKIQASTVLVKFLQIVKRLTYSFPDGPLQYRKLGLSTDLQQLSSDPQFPIICRRLVHQIERTVAGKLDNPFS